MPLKMFSTTILPLKSFVRYPLGVIDLQETLVDRIAERLSNLPGVELIRISSEKTEAYDDADAIGVEVWRSGSPLLT